MEAIRNILGNIVKSVQEKHDVAIQKSAKEGKHIGLERVFRRAVEERFGAKVFSFTDRERGNLSMLVGDLGEETGAFLVDAVINWKEFTTEEYLKHLPPTPVFQDLFFNRQRIISRLSSLKKKEEKRVEFIEKLKPIVAEAEKKPESEKYNLMDIFLKERQRVREEKEKVQNG